MTRRWNAIKKRQMNNIEMLYLNSQGVKKNYQTALEWFNKSADAGDIQAMKNIADIFEEGKGVKKDAKTAAEWRRKADEAYGCADSITAK
jgi:TPR repeat protein